MNIQIMGDLGEWQATTGNIYWMGGDYNMSSDKLEELEWTKQMQGSLREGDRRIGTCTCATPATSIDYHMVHKKIEQMTTEAHIDLATKLPPRRPVWATLQLTGGGNRSLYRKC